MTKNSLLYSPDDKFVINEFKKAIHKYAKMPVIDFDNSISVKLDFQAIRFEDILKITGPSIPPNKWSLYRIGLVTRGSGEFIAGVHKFKASKNTLIVWPSRIITSSKNWSTDTKGYLLLFNLDFFLQNNFPHKYIRDKKILTSAREPFIELTDEKADDLAAIFDIIFREDASRRKHKLEMIALKTVELLILSERLFEQQNKFEPDPPSLDIIKKFVDLLEVGFLEERSVGFYASQLNLHPNYLNSLIKKHRGLTAKECIQNRLLLEAKYLLLSTNLSIKQISIELGFADPNYFTVFFKKYEDISPVGYRASFI